MNNSISTPTIPDFPQHSLLKSVGLHGVLAKIRDMNLPLISVTQVEANSKGEANPLYSEQAKSKGGAYAD